MDWSKGMEGNRPWLNMEQYQNFPARYPYPPPQNGFNGPPPTWNQYSAPYGNYPYPPGNWTYGTGISPPGTETSQVPETKSVEKQLDLSKVNPPLPPDPPPQEPPLPPAMTKDKKDETTTDKKSDTKIPAIEVLIPKDNPMLIIDPNVPPPPPPPLPEEKPLETNNQGNTMNYPTGPPPNADWYMDSIYRQNAHDILKNQGSQVSDKTKFSMDNPIKFNLPTNQNFNATKYSIENSKKMNADKGNFAGKKHQFNRNWSENTENFQNQTPPEQFKRQQWPMKNENFQNQTPPEQFKRQQWPVKNEDFQNQTSPEQFKRQQWPAKTENFLNKTPPEQFKREQWPAKNENFQNQNEVPKPPNNNGAISHCGNTSVDMAASGDWPSSLKIYVGKCFDRCVTEIDKDQVEICLKGKLTLAARNGTLYTKNWDEEPLIGVFSVNNAATSSGTKNFYGNNNSKFPNRRIGGDVSRGFTISKRSCSRSRSRSKSRSRERRFPYDSPEKGFIGFKGGRGGGGKNNRKNKGKKNAGNNNNEKKGNFYTKAGMTLEPELCTQDRLNKRAARFGDGPTPTRGANKRGKKRKINISMSINSAFTIDRNSENIDWSSMHIVGSSTALEKQYLRLTSAPDPSTVRNISTLKRSLIHVKKCWKVKHDYRFTCDQLKAIRQDLTVQGLRDEFTREVYETHCRVALEKGDHEEFNQCQTQLKDLYSQIGGDHQHEFNAYRLLYYIYTSNTLDMTSMLASLSETDRKDRCVLFALKLRAAWSLNNYYQFFKLYRNAPKMTGFLVDWFIERERKNAIKRIVRSYRPGNLDVEYVKSMLAFSNEDWVQFVEGVGIAFTDKTNSMIDCKTTAATLLPTS